MNPRAPKILALPLYAGLSSDQQLAVFDDPPDDTRKVIISTNIAEASVTIADVAYVIDCGFVKMRAYNPHTGIETLTAVPISKASAIQRAGRAGRTKPGKCYRLYPENAFESMAETSVPEIQRSNLAPVILQLKALGIDNVARFDYLTPPPSELMIRGLELLFSLGALDEHAKLTRPLGMRMAEFPVDPMMAKIVLNSLSFDCAEQILTIAAMTTDSNVFVEHEGARKPAQSAKRKFAVEEGDHLTLLNVYQAFTTKGQKSAKWCRDNFLNYKALQRAVSVRAQLVRYMEKFGISPQSLVSKNATADNIRQCLVTGYFAHAARMQPDGSFVTVDGKTRLWAHPSSVMFVSRGQTLVVLRRVFLTVM